MKLLIHAAIILFGLLPSPTTGKRVYDFDSVLSESGRAELVVLANDVETKTTAEFAIVTVSSLDGESIDTYANRLFNTWGIGKKTTNNGVLFLIAPNERRVRIEVGYGLEPLLTDSLTGEILDLYVVPRFKEGDMEGGIVAGAKEIGRILLENPDAAKGIPGSAPKEIRTGKAETKDLIYVSLGVSVLFFILSFVLSAKETFPTAFFYGGILLVLGLAGYTAYRLIAVFALDLVPLELFGVSGGALTALWAGVRKFRRFGPHYCTACGTRLQLLDEKKDDESLSEVQKLEETIGSVDYDVWYCPSCLKKDVKRYVSTFSSFQKCPQCDSQTLKVVQTTVSSPTYSSSGLARINKDCVHCKHSETSTKVLPKLTRSSSSGSGGGGGSFGGGSSGGGGSSRGW